MRHIPTIAWLSIATLLCALLFALFGGWLSDHAATQQNLLARMRPPLLFGGDFEFPLGTDRLGRDLLARMAEGLRISLLIALLGSVLGALFGCTLGFVAAHFRGWVEETIMMVVDIQASLPFILIALTLLAFFGNSFGLLIFLMAMFGWDSYARLSRGVVLSAKSQPWAEAVRTLGVPPVALYLRHVLPNVAGILIVQLTLNFPQIILLESALSFLGLGIQPPMTSLGQIMGDGRDYLSTSWWISVLPGLTIFLVSLAMCVLGDWLRDRLDPALQRVRQ
ncbi:ABC transporter permease [Nitratireductor aquibiodomus]|uniref:Peptide/nickel transport system permease protein n=1 Tax=Nitratireductor aquibiodomus TaxID=204799 RepID=A0A1H4MQQ2_9HYPH|nr:peptide/nickel transport system permease protein [Nitratireductor aquibiodomus]